MGRQSVGTAELGVELMRRRWAFAEAVYVRVRTVDAKRAPEYDAEKVAAADKAENETEALIDEIAEAILERPVTELSHLTDLALVEALDDIHRDEYSRKDKATTRLGDAILRLAGIPQSTSSMDAVYKQVARAHKTIEGHVA
jgi:hypothetical protein